MSAAASADHEARGDGSGSSGEGISGEADTSSWKVCAAASGDHEARGDGSGSGGRGISGEPDTSSWKMCAARAGVHQSEDNGGGSADSAGSGQDDSEDEGNAEHELEDHTIRCRVGEEDHAEGEGDAEQEVENHTIRCRVGEEGYRLWNLALQLCRHIGGDDLPEWKCVEVVLDHFVEVWGERDEGPPFVHILERDGWQCTVPGCRARRNLAVHHVRYRSRGGGDDDWNLTTVCFEHHIQGIHEDRIRCRGTAPEGLVWELGIRPGGQATATYIGDRLVVPDRGGDGRQPAEAA
jgi:hypothetical protein